MVPAGGHPCDEHLAAASRGRPPGCCAQWPQLAVFVAAEAVTDCQDRLTDCVHPFRDARLQVLPSLVRERSGTR